MNATAASAYCSAFSSCSSVHFKNDKKIHHCSPRSHLCRPLGPPSNLLKKSLYSCLRISLSDRFIVRCFNDSDRLPDQQIAILLEIDGVLIDAYHSGNRQAFNVAFQKLGLDCAKWTQPVYSDLIRKAAGDERRMVILYFNRIGWPTSLPTTEKDGFVQSVFREKKKAIDEILLSKDLTLRYGVEKFIDDALDEGMPVVVLAASSFLGEKIARAIVNRLGLERVNRLKIIGKEDVENSSYGRLVFGSGAFSAVDEELLKEASKAVAVEKQKVAEEVAAKLKLRVDLNVNSTESMKWNVAVLRTGAEYADVPIRNCVLVAGTQIGLTAAEQIGIPYIVIRNSLISLAKFPSAKAVLDGFGDVDLTVSKLRRKLQRE